MMSASVADADKAQRRLLRANKLRNRIILLVALSAALYPVLTGLGLFASLLTVIPVDVRGNISHALYEASMYLAAFGLTAAVALSFVYAGIKRWDTSLNRSKRKAAMFGVYGVVTVLFSFSAFAILLALVDSLWVK